MPRAGSLAAPSVFATQQIDAGALAAKHGQARIELMLAMQELVSDDSQIFELRNRRDHGDEVTVGRSAHNDITIIDSTVSAEHAVIDTGNPVLLEDIGSSNGTFVNHVRLAHHESIALRSGDCVRFGARVFYYVNGDRLVLFMQLRIAGTQR